METIQQIIYRLGATIFPDAVPKSEELARLIRLCRRWSNMQIARANGDIYKNLEIRGMTYETANRIAEEKDKAVEDKILETAKLIDSGWTVEYGSLYVEVRDANRRHIRL